MRLYHFTSGIHLAHFILPEGFLKLTDSNIHPVIENHGPPVVWLTSNPDPTRNTGLDGSFMLLNGTRFDLNKREVRFTIDIDDAIHWPEFARDQRMASDAYYSLAATGGDPEEWWVVPREITWQDWVRIQVEQEGKRSFDFDATDIEALVREAQEERVNGTV